MSQSRWRSRHLGSHTESYFQIVILFLASYSTIIKSLTWTDAAGLISGSWQVSFMSETPEQYTGFKTKPADGYMMWAYVCVLKRHTWLSHLVFHLIFVTTAVLKAYLKLLFTFIQILNYPAGLFCLSSLCNLVFHPAAEKRTILFTEASFSSCATHTTQEKLPCSSASVIQDLQGFHR